MIDAKPEIRTPLAWRAVVCVFSGRKSYRKIHVAYLRRMNQGPGFDALYTPDTWPAKQREWSDRADVDRAELRRRIATSFVIVAVAGGLSLCVGVARGALSPNLPWHLGKMLTFVGGGLMAWATAFGLGSAPATWGGSSLPELIKPKIFLLIFVPGLLAAFIAGLL